MPLGGNNPVANPAPPHLGCIHARAVEWGRLDSHANQTPNPMPPTEAQIKEKLRTGARGDVIVRRGDEWRHAQTKGGICVGTSTYDTLEEAKRFTWSDNVKVKH